MTYEEAVKHALKMVDNCIDIKINCSGAKEIIKDVLSKQLTLKPFFDNIEDFYHCSRCEAIVLKTQNYCDFCGQKIDWPIED